MTTTMMIRWACGHVTPAPAGQTQQWDGERASILRCSDCMDEED